MLFPKPFTIQVNVSTIDQFTRIGRDMVKDEQGNWRLYSEQDFIDYVTKPRTSFVMQRGTAFHAIVQTPEKFHREYKGQTFFKFKDFTFDAGALTKTLETLAPFRPQVQWEQYYTKNYFFDGISVKVTAKADGLLRDRLLELKTTRRFDAEKYEKSWQWRFYMDIFQREVIHYYVFVLPEENDVEIGIEQLVFNKPDDLEIGCKDYVLQMANFVRDRNLEEYFRLK